MEPAAMEHGHIRFLGSFVSPSLEHDFRCKQLREEIRLAIGCAIVSLAGSVLYLTSGYKLYGVSDQFLALVVARTAITGASLALLFALRRCKSPVQFDRAVLLWCLVMVLGNLATIATRSTGQIGQALMCLGVPLVGYCILPLPLSRQLLLAVPFSLAALLIAFISGVDSLPLRTLAGGYLIANAIGAFASWQLNHRRRQVYRAGLRETELRAQLEQALAETRTLRGMLHMCAWCKRIRGEEHTWQSVEAYVQHHSHAQFSHGICEHCIREQFGEDLTQRRQDAKSC